MNSEKVKEIKECLKNCINDCGATSCPYDKYEKGLKCIEDLQKDALTLINELEQTNETLENELSTYAKMLGQFGYNDIKECEKLEKRIKELENDELIEESFKDLSIANKLLEENRVLKIENENAQKALHNYLQSRSEIRKEMAREILNEFNNFLPNRATSNIEIKKDSLEDVRKALTVLAQAYHDKTQELAKQFDVEVEE